MRKNSCVTPQIDLFQLCVKIQETCTTMASLQQLAVAYSIKEISIKGSQHEIPIINACLPFSSQQFSASAIQHCSFQGTGIRRFNLLDVSVSERHLLYHCSKEGDTFQLHASPPVSCPTVAGGGSSQIHRRRLKRGTNSVLFFKVNGADKSFQRNLHPTREAKTTIWEAF